MRVLGVVAESVWTTKDPVDTRPLVATNRTVTSSVSPAAMVAGSAGPPSSWNGPVIGSPVTRSGPVPVLRMRRVERSCTPLLGGDVSVRRGFPDR